MFKKALYKTVFPNLDKDTNNLFLVTSFNEWYEDTQIEPTKSVADTSTKDISESSIYYSGGFSWEDYGAKYLDILRELTVK